MREASTASARTRLAGAALVGMLCHLATAPFAAWHVALLAGWDGLAMAFTASAWVGVYGLSADEARSVATREDPSRAAADLLLVLASVASLVGTGATLLEAGGVKGTGNAILTALATVSVGLSWFVVHTVYMLRYARLYYGGTPGGIEFAGDEPPTYRDFAYLALTIGMTYQVSDTELTSPPIRATALRQALLSYLFGVCIVGVTINAVAGLFK